MNTAYELLVAKAEELAPEGYLAAFKTDMVNHDRRALERAPEGTPFLWCIREHGTWIQTRQMHLDPEMSHAWRASTFRCLAGFFLPQEEKHKVYYYDGKTLTEVKHSEDAHRILVDWESKK